MQTYLMFGRYSSEALQGISAERTEKAIAVVRKNGGNVKSMYAVLGEYDLCFIIDFPDIEKAMKTSVELYRLTRISFTTSLAVDIERFDKLMSDIKEI